jgi:hypothetical protein
VPNPRAKAAIVKLYDVPKSGDIKLTDMLEVVGVVSLDPALAHVEAGGGEEEEMMMMGTAPHLPPPSLVPRLHVVSYTKLNHNNPLGRRENFFAVLLIFLSEFFINNHSCGSGPCMIRQTARNKWQVRASDIK